MQIEEVIPHFDISLRAANRRERTRETYILAVEQLADYLKKNGHTTEVDEVTRNDIRGFIGHVLDINSDATARQRDNSLRQFWKWVTDEGMREDSPMDGMKPPKVVDKPVELISEDQFKALLATCDTATFNGRRDLAIIRVLWDTGMRLEEVAKMEVHHIFLFEKTIRIPDGKGGKAREIRFTDDTQYALSRYEMLRKKHRLTDEDAYWLGKRGRLQRRGISQMLTRRSERLGFHVHPHQFRHSFADRWLAAGGNEGDLMALMGWSRGSRGMLDRYGAINRDRRALSAYEAMWG